MSSYDDDEALFDDLYDDDTNANTESKQPVNESESLASGSTKTTTTTATDSKAAGAAGAAVDTAGTAGPETSSTSNPTVSEGSNNGSNAAPEGSGENTFSNSNATAAFLPGTPNSMGAATPQSASGGLPPPGGSMDSLQAGQFMQMTPEMQLSFQQFQQFQQQQQSMFQGGGGGTGGAASLPGMPPMPQDPGNAPPPPPSVMPPSNMGKESGKMFIGGLNWDTTEQGLVEYFSKFGEVLDHTIMRDASTGRSRGFGFLTFREPGSVDKVIAETHVLDGKLIDPKRAIAREEQDKVGKIFVGGIDPMVTEQEFNEFFSQFGSIIDAQLMIDKDTGRSRGFGFITYDSPAAVDRVTVNKYLNLKGKAMEVKRAEPRGQHQQNQMQQAQQAQQAQLYAAYGAAAAAGGYGGQYGQGSYPQGMAAYGQNMTPEMQAYWQRMQQWYMYQQAVAAAGGQPQDGQPQLPLQTTGSGEAAPLNPQQQAAKQSENEQKQQQQPDGGDADVDSRRSGNRDFQEPRRLNLPKGPRRAPPSGPSGGSRGRGGHYNRSKGYHPYSRGRRP